MCIPGSDKNKMIACFVPIIDEDVFVGGTVLHEAAVSPNKKKATKFCLTVFSINFKVTIDFPAL